MRLALAQFNAVVGDLKGNVQDMHRLWEQAKQLGAEMVLFPELAICGYPPEDLVFRRRFLQDCRSAVEDLASRCSKGTTVVGFPLLDGGSVYNAAAMIIDGRIADIYRKCRLPNFAVFDESRYFKPGRKPLVLEVAGIRTAITICFDIWDIAWLIQCLQGHQPQLIVNISASPFDLGKLDRRKAVIARAAGHFRCPVAYCNLVGGQDELVFDGRSMVVSPDGQLVAQAKAFEQDLQVVEVVDRQGRICVSQVTEPVRPLCSAVEEVYHALLLGTRDYVRKNGFSQVMVGVSGGIDSAVTLAVAAGAVGSKNVWAVSMPSRFNSPQTVADAEAVATNIGTRFVCIPIDTILGSYHRQLLLAQGWNDRGIAYENLQSRIRGTILMSLSNHFSQLVLTTGNKSELSTGYATLYGDTAGAFAVLKDVPKTLVYELARYINDLAGRQVIPESIIKRPPSAELRPGQLDSDTLPPYPILDQIISKYVEQDLDPDQIVAMGLPQVEVRKAVTMIDRSEFKRRQCPPGVRITSKAFGKDRRLPITNRYNPFV